MRKNVHLHIVVNTEFLESLKKQIQRIYKSGFKHINALHSVHSENIENIDDMMSILEIIPFGKIMFTPYLVTENFGNNKVSRITLKYIGQSKEIIDIVYEKYHGKKTL